MVGSWTLGRLREEDVILGIQGQSEQYRQRNSLRNTYRATEMLSPWNPAKKLARWHLLALLVFPAAERWEMKTDRSPRSHWLGSPTYLVKS